MINKQLTIINYQSKVVCCFWSVETNAPNYVANSMCLNDKQFKACHSSWNYVNSIMSIVIDLTQLIP